MPPGGRFEGVIEWDIKKLRILRTLAHRGTVTATAEALHMTPSAVSQQLTNLARQLGVPLLEAQGRRVRLTDAAHLVLRHTEAVFAQLERADAELTGYLAGEAGRCGSGPSPPPYRCWSSPPSPPCGAATPGSRSGSGRPRPPSPTNCSRPGPSTSRCRWPRTRRGPGTRASRGSPCWRTRWTWPCRPTIRWPAAAGGVRLADLAGERWIYGGSGPWSEITRTACEAAGFVPERAHSASGWTAILAMVGAGMGVALVPRMVSGRAEGVAVRVLPHDRPTRHVIAALRRGSESAPALSRVLSALRAAASPS